MGRSLQRSRRSGPIRLLLPSVGSVLGLTALANALFFRAHHMFTWDGDVGRHIRVGRRILATGTIPGTDMFSHTRAGQPFVPYEWLSETITALADAWLGLPGVVILSALLFTTAVLAIYRTAEELGAPRIVALLVAVLALLLQSVHLLPRPHLFTTALAGVFMVLLVRFARSGNEWRLAALPILMLVWANAHGGFLIGFVLIGGFLAGAVLRSTEFAAPREAVRPLVIAFGLCVAASLINPAGPNLWAHTMGYLGIDFLINATQEYQSVDFHQGYGKLFFVALFAGPALWMTGRVVVSRLAGLLYLLFAAAALHSARNIPLFTVVALPWLSVWIRDILATESAGSRALGRLARLDAIDRLLWPGLSTAIGACLIWLAAGPAANAYRFDPRAFPVSVVERLGNELPPGNVFNQMMWGGYLLYLRDDVPVFIDGQTDFYGPELSREYLTVIKGRPGWQEVLDRHDVGWTLTRVSEPINQLLAIDSGWELLTSDGVAAVYRRARR